MNRKILCVDDDVNLLSGIKRVLRNKFEFDLASNGDQGLTFLAERGPYAVMVVDMRMPGMNGIEFLTKAQEKAPDTVRIMLTGNADQQTAVAAVNGGHVYQFLTKPCSPDQLEIALNRGIKQYELIMAERELLEQTLNGSAKVLTDILAVVEPQSFGRSQQLRELMHLYIQTPNDRSWELELAALLAPIGSVTVPPNLLNKRNSAESLSEEEIGILEKMPEFASRLVQQIPRLETVSKIILYQHKHFDGTGFPQDECANDAIPIGSRILKVLNDLLDLEARGDTRDVALQKMQQCSGIYDPKVLDAAFLRFDAYLAKPTPVKRTVRNVMPDELKVGQVLFSSVYTKDDMLVIKKGTMVSLMVLERLQNFARLGSLRIPLEIE